MLRHTLAAATMLAAIGPVGAARAQPVDPPARVGRVARVSGTVSYRLGTDPAWRPATINLPVTTGTALWTEPGGMADLGVGGTHLAIDASTEIDVTRLDDHAMDVTQPQGALCLHPFTVPRGDTYTVQTPRGTVTISAAGRYEVVAGDTAHPTTVTVLDGAAQVVGATFTMAVGPNQTAAIDGDGQETPFRTALGAATRDGFLAACLARERPVPRNRPPVVAGMTGSDALDEYGSWTPNPQYGPVWFPRDAPGYVPYRDGHWTYVAPWGWTWVDDAPWGFAPSHYGRWVQVDDRWGWVASQPGPAVYAAPVYAPAVVGFLAGAAFGTLVADRPVGWVPLGPREPYYPPYRVSDRYVRNVNVTNIRNVSTVVQTYNTTVVNNAPPRPGPGGFANVRGATVAPGAAVAAGQQIAPVAQPVPPAALQQASFVRPPAPAAGPMVGTPSPGPAVAGPPTGRRPALLRVVGEPPAVPGAVPGAPPGRPGGVERATGAPGTVPNALPGAAPGAVPAGNAGQPGTPPSLRAPGAGRPVGPTPAFAPPGPRPDTQGPGIQGPGTAGPGAATALRETGAPRPAEPAPGNRPERGPAPQAPEIQAPQIRAPEARGAEGRAPEVRPAVPGGPPRTAEPARQAGQDRPAAPAMPQAAPVRPVQPAPRPMAPAPRPEPPQQPRAAAPVPQFHPQPQPRAEPHAEPQPQPRPAPQAFRPPAPQPPPQFHAPAPPPQFHPQPAPPPMQPRPAPPQPQPHPAPQAAPPQHGGPPPGHPGPRRPGEPG